MKKWLILLAAAMLLLAGCGEVAETVPTAVTSPATEPTLPPETCYVADSAMERVTDGVVRQYAMNSVVEGFTMMGTDLLVYTSDQVLHLLGGENLRVLSRRQLPAPLQWSGQELMTGQDRVAYFDRESGSYVMLSGTLSLISQMQVTGEMTAGPVMASDFNTVYYAEGTDIRALDLSTGVSRLLRQENAEIVALDGVFFRDTVLRYTRRLSDGSLQTCFVDSRSGAAFHTADFPGKLVSWEDSYAGVMTNAHPLAQVSLVVCGDLNGKLQILEPGQEWEYAIFPGNGLVVLQTVDKLGLHLSCYELENGSRIGAVTMPHRDTFFPMGCVDGEKIWLCDGKSERFYCWDMSMTPAADPVGSLRQYYSLGDPDQAGMAECLLRAEELGLQYGIRISFEQKNHRTTGVDYSGYLDHQVPMYTAALETLEYTFGKLPGWLLSRMAQCTEENLLEIILVDDYDPAKAYAGGEGDMSMDGGQATVRISMSADLEQLLLHQLFHVAEVRIQNTRDGFSDWEDMNPEGFAYAGEDAYTAGYLKDSPYLTFGSNYFTDEYAMVGPREDRAQLFAWALAEGQAERFASDAMQTKLQRICYLLRKAYWIDKGEVLLWEQYLIPEK